MKFPFAAHKNKYNNPQPHVLQRWDALEQSYSIAGLPIQNLSHLGSASIVQEEAGAIFEPEVMEDTQKTKVSKLTWYMYMFDQTLKQHVQAYMDLIRRTLSVEMRSGNMPLSLTKKLKSLIDKHF